MWGESSGRVGYVVVSGAGGGCLSVLVSILTYVLSIHVCVCVLHVRVLKVCVCKVVSVCVL